MFVLCSRESGGDAMGISAGWLSVEGLGREEVLGRLGMSEVGGEMNLADRWLPRGGAGVGVLADGRILVIREEQFEPSELHALSEGFSVAVGGLEEHVGFEDAYVITDGQVVWRVTLDEDAEINVTGRLPGDVAKLMKRAERDEDPDGVIMQAAAAHTGYRPDEDGPGFDNRISLVAKPKPEKVKAARTSSGGFWKRLFGGGR
jgi:hypothetical protein